jgi:hypothetical protein
VPRTAIAPTTSSQKGRTPKPGIASRASPGKSSHCQPSTMNSSNAVPRSSTHTIGGKGVAKAPIVSEMPAMANARASRFLENLIAVFLLGSMGGVAILRAPTRRSNSEGSKSLIGTAPSRFRANAQRAFSRAGVAPIGRARPEPRSAQPHRPWRICARSAPHR